MERDAAGARRRELFAQVLVVERAGRIAQAVHHLEDVRDAGEEVCGRQFRQPEPCSERLVEQVQVGRLTKGIGATWQRRLPVVQRHLVETVAVEERRRLSVRIRATLDEPAADLRIVAAHAFLNRRQRDPGGWHRLT